MAYRFCGISRRSELYSNIYAKDRKQGMKPNQLKLEGNAANKKDENITTKLESSINEYVVRKLIWTKHSKDEVIIKTAVTTTIKILFFGELFDSYDNADEKLEDYLLGVVNENRRPSFVSLNDVIQ